MTDDVSIHSKSQKVLNKSAEKSVLYATTKVRKSIKSLKIHHLKTTCQKIWNQENVNQWVINYHLKMCSNEHNAAYNHAWLCSIHFTNLSNLQDLWDVYIDHGTVLVFKIEKFKFAEISEKKLNYWKAPSGKQYCWTTVEIVAFENLQIFQMPTSRNAFWT